MKTVFVVSICCKEGVLGGGLYVDSKKLKYRTGKVTVSPKIKNLEIPLANILEVTKGWSLCFPTVTIKMSNGESYKFIIFARKRFLRTIKELGVVIE